jgi:hypothetical protein
MSCCASGLTLGVNWIDIGFFSASQGFTLIYVYDRLSALFLIYRALPVFFVYLKLHFGTI